MQIYIRSIKVYIVSKSRVSIINIELIAIYSCSIILKLNDAEEGTCQKAV